MCSPANSFPLSIGPYFNFGAYEVTPFTYLSILVESKSKNMTGAWVPATRIGPVLKQHKKSTETYETDKMHSKKMQIRRKRRTVYSN